MRSYKYTLYVWHNEETDSYFETDSLYELLKHLWRNRKEQCRVTWSKSKGK